MTPFTRQLANLIDDKDVWEKLLKYRVSKPIVIGHDSVTFKKQICPINDADVRAAHQLIEQLVDHRPNYEIDDPISLASFEELYQNVDQSSIMKLLGKLASFRIVVTDYDPGRYIEMFDNILHVEDSGKLYCDIYFYITDSYVCHCRVIHKLANYLMGNDKVDFLNSATYQRLARHVDGTDSFNNLNGPIELLEDYYQDIEISEELEAIVMNL